MLEDLTAFDFAALATFFAVWIGYSVLFDGRFRPRNSLNAHMIAIRETWMVRLLERDNRVMDAMLTGFSVRTSTFFASTTIIVVAALVGVLGAAEQVHTATARLSTLLPQGTLGQFELKVLLLIAIFVHAFFRFTWAIRQFTYFTAVLGSAPNADGSPADRAFAKRMTRIRSRAVVALNGGLRSYYFALAALGWFIHPLLLVGTSLLMACVLVRRQLFSASARAVAEHASHMSANP